MVKKEGMGSFEVIIKNVFWEFWKNNLFLKKCLFFKILARLIFSLSNKLKNKFRKINFEYTVFYKNTHFFIRNLTRGVGVNTLISKNFGGKTLGEIFKNHDFLRK